MKISLTAFVSLDGVHQAPGGPEEDTSGGFTQGGWSVPYGDEDFGRFMTEVFDRAEAFLLGRRTYEIFAAHWPRVTDPADPVAGKLNKLPKYVASTTLASADWAHTTVLGEDVPERVGQLKSRPGGELQVHGSARLAQTLLAHGLVDTLHLLVFPVVLGSGRTLFGAGALPTAFTLDGVRTTSTGVVIHTYEAAGRPEYGTYALDPETS
ncbi:MULTISPECIES: dihydrofolate reductase family protein [Streptomyces]|uniref:Bifunctional deaminase-reductase domain-containing protein n=1 Tax=Streptomyces albus (strain ATCC 21838 / DSM 41398 / FERM P-419 / JCM 4703 / NBRC 107858) TaxID=1081613 RepID=A0A0B5ENR3_STRA4|nr:dihydrofolate reductase family protein [Streptomyces sp. SCSIO ZS0520]AJE80945.1 bifunctional deaminase-reductase domain-containing protein [Streptomyces albus]AOU75258.1 bifunctional deaminase-reductase domain-containing protein [Streptomyces albus]AYN31063.1 deaminase/reductase [Streptomyces albus]